MVYRVVERAGVFRIQWRGLFCWRFYKEYVAFYMDGRWEIKEFKTADSACDFKKKLEERDTQALIRKAQEAKGWQPVYCCNK